MTVTEKITENNKAPSKSNPKKHELNIQCEGLFKIYKQGNLEVVALKDVDLKIYKGELVVIMGPSGSGKTTLLNTISGLEKPSAGSIKIRGVEITKLNEESIQFFLQNEVGIVFQFFNLVPSLTAYGNIELPMIIANKSAGERKSRINQLLESIGLEKRAKHRPHTMSGGERQRIAVAMAFANNPSIILADEPTGNIDSISAQKVMNIFKQFLKENPDKSIIIVTHDPKFRKIADRTLVIKDGQIIKELGKMELTNVSNGNGDIASNGLSKIYTDDGKVDRVEELLNPHTRAIDYKEIKICPKCQSENIVKKTDDDNGSCVIANDQVTTRCAIYCRDCGQLTFYTCSLFNIKNGKLD